MIFQHGGMSPVLPVTDEADVEQLMSLHVAIKWKMACLKQQKMVTVCLITIYAYQAGVGAV